MMYCLKKKPWTRISIIKTTQFGTREVLVICYVYWLEYLSTKIPVTLTISSTRLPAASPRQEQVDVVENRKERTETHRERTRARAVILTFRWSGGLGWRWKHAEDHGDSRWREIAQTLVEFTSIHRQSWRGGAWGVATRELGCSQKYFW